MSGASEGIEKVDKTPMTASPRKPTQEIKLNGTACFNTCN